jgi:tetratricopeptide (TPR) repeat protein
MWPKRSYFALAGLLVAGGAVRGQQTAAKPAAPVAAHKEAQEQVPDSEFESSRKLAQQGKFDEALATLNQVSAKDPAKRGLAHELGVTYYKKNDFANAITYLKKAQQEDAKDNEAVQLLGLSYYLAGHPADAIPLLEKVQTWYPSANVDAAYILGVCYIQTKGYEQARAAFAKMFGVPPDSAASYLFTARMLLRQDFSPVAEEYARKAVALDPKLPLAHFLIGEVDLYHSKIDEAIAEFEKEVQLNPGHAAAYYRLADAYSRVQKFDQAERLLQRSIWLDSTATGPYILLGKVLQKKGEAELAARALERALAMDPKNPLPHYLLGQAYRDLGRTEDAERELKAAAQLQSH